MFHKYGSTWPEMFCKNYVFKSFTKISRKHLCWSLVLRKNAPDTLKGDSETGFFL